MHWLVAVFAAASGFTMSFAICAFIWTWYVGTVVLVVSNESPKPAPVLQTDASLISTGSR